MPSLTRKTDCHTPTNAGRCRSPSTKPQRAQTLRRGLRQDVAGRYQAEARVPVPRQARRGERRRARKEVALLSAILEFGRRRGEVETNPCRGIEYNPTRPRQHCVRQDAIDLAVEVARLRRCVGDQHPSSVYLILALRVKAAYLTVSRPTEMREIHHQSIRPEGVEVPIGK